MAHRQFKVNLIPTISVTRKSDGQECVINETDFDDSKHSLSRVAPTKKAPVKKPPPVEGADTR